VAQLPGDRSGLPHIGFSGGGHGYADLVGLYADGQLNNEKGPLIAHDPSFRGFEPIFACSGFCLSA
jgi:hypothetical protein